MSTTGTSSSTSESPLENLIPSLQNDIALRCLARFPRQYHPVLAAVSKPIRSLVNSPELFAARSALNCTQLLLYLRIRNRYCQPKGWFTLCPRPNPNSSTGNINMARVPENPGDLLDSSVWATLGPKIYVLGSGLYDRSTDVWILDCRLHTWERGPSMPMARKGDAKTVVFDSNIYVIGGWRFEDSWADVLDTLAGR